MDIRLSELQQLIRDNAEEFLELEVPPARVREIEAAKAPDEALWKQMVDLGWTGLPIAETYGGGGADLIDLGVLIEQICRHALPSPFQQTMLSAAVLQKHAAEDIKQAFLPRIAGGMTIVPALKEGHGRLRNDFATTYTDGKVRGEKRFVEFGETSDYHLVAAIRDGAPGLALVPRDQGGVQCRPLQSFGATPQAIVTYEDATTDGWVEGAEVVEYLRLLGGAITALECYAHAQQALDMTVEYVQIRVAFGRPIGTFEVVQARVADIATFVQAARFLVYELLYQFDIDQVDPVQVASVKGIAARTVTEATNWGHILHGGVGFMAEYDLQFHTRRGKEAAIRWGDPREVTNVVAEAVLA